MESEEERLATPRLGTVRGEARLEIGDLRAALRRMPGLRALGWGAAWIAVMALGQLLTFVWIGALAPGGWWVFVAGAVMLVSLVALARQPRRALERMSSAQRELTFEIDEHGFATRNGADESTRIAWASVKEVIVGPEHMFFVTAAGLQPIPRRAFAPHDFDRALEIARRAVPRAVHRGPWRLLRVGLLLVGLLAIVGLYAAYHIATGLSRQGAARAIPCGLELAVRRTSATTFEADVAFRNDGPEDLMGWTGGIAILVYQDHGEPEIVVPTWSDQLVAVPAHGRSVSFTEPLAVDATGRWHFVATYDDTHFYAGQPATPMCEGYAGSAEVSFDVDVE